MHNFHRLLLVTACSATLSLKTTISVADDAAPQAARSTSISTAVEAGLKYLDERGQWWLDKKKCVSCHRTAFVPWALQSARERGLNVSNEDLARWQAANLKDPGGKGNLEGLSQLILGRVPSPVATKVAVNAESPEEPTAYAEFARLLIENQQPDGAWKAGGQLPRQKRPAEETRQVSTMWNLLALESLRPADDRRQAAEKARGFIQKTTYQTDAAPPKSVEWYTLKVALHSPSDRSEELGEAVNKLLALQNDNGGWGWLTGEASHAMSTGLAIYFLSQSPASVEPEVAAATQKGVAWLLSTQKDDGTWASTGTKANAKGKVVETATYWSSAWAVLGLLETLPPQPAVAAASE